MSEPENSVDALKDQARKLVEWNQEFLIIVKNKDGAMCWKSSDKTWAIGAAMRYLTACEEEERCQQRVFEENTGDNNES